MHTAKITLIHTEWESWSLTFSVNNGFEKQQTIGFKSTTNSLFLWYKSNYVRNKKTQNHKKQQQQKKMQKNKHTSLTPITERATTIIFICCGGSNNQQ